MYHVRFKGTHYDSGYRYGSLIKRNGIILNSCPTFPINEKRIAFGKECVNKIKIYYPEIVDEVKGLADGNGADYDFLCALIFTMYCNDRATHCSCFTYHDEKSTVFGRNSDFLVSIEKLYMNVLYNVDGVFAFTGNTTAFVEIEDGVNEYGFSVGLTFIPIKNVEPGFNVGILTRYLLKKCKTVNEALGYIQKLPIASGGTLTMADKTGNIAVIELSPQKIVVRRGEKGFVCSTNVYISEEMKQYESDVFDNWKAETRYMTLRNALERHKYSIDFSKELLGGKYGFICQYDRKQNADTVWSVIYDLKKGRILRVEGNPGRKAFKEDNRFKFI